MNENGAAMDLLPLDILEEASRVLQTGAAKHGRESWKSKDSSLFVSALLRHMAAINRGEIYDPDSGRLHSLHVLCNAMFLAWHDARNQGGLTANG
jgi:hypothetical protein